MRLTLARPFCRAGRFTAFTAAFALFCTSLLTAPHSVHADVVVQQVEAFENPPTNTHYAPINFAGSGTGTDVVSFPGVTFHAQANTTDTASNHAFQVGLRLYAPGGVGTPFISNVFCQTANNFINGLNTQGTLAAGQPIPGGFGNSIKVSNHSYVADFGNATADENAIRRIDYVVNNEDVVMCAGAVTGGVFANQNLVWSARNTLAVRGDHPSTPFDPSAGAGNTITSGKRRADLWSDQESSFATGRVSGYAAGLIGTATANAQPLATHNQVIRSLLMTGADKTAVGTVVPAWTRDTANNLDVDAGAGKANYPESLSILNAGQQTLQTVTGSNIPNVSTSNLKGWAYGTSTNGKEAIVINAPNGISGLTATLNWNVTQTVTGGVTIDTSNAGQVFPDLALELVPVTFSAGSFVLGPSTGKLGLSSNAGLDNVEHLFFTGATGGGDLGAGSYALLITGDVSQVANIGVSYDIGAAPEPASLSLLAITGTLLLTRRRRLH
jgi:hypothetical protein